MSSFAKRQLEKMGWKEGQGLGKDGSGVASFIKVQRRDPKLQSGLGHEAGKGGADNSDMGLDSLLGSLAGKSKKMSNRSASSSSSSSADADVHKPNEATRNSEDAPQQRKKRAAKRAHSSSSSSSISSSDDDGVASGRSKETVASATGGSNVLTWTDAELLQRCGGVRLGRAGRHRFFNGKLARIEASHKKEGDTAE